MLASVVHGHFDLDLLDIEPDAGESTEDATKRVKINCGIATVVPVSKILEVIYQPMLFEMRKKSYANYARQRAATPD